MYLQKTKSKRFRTPEFKNKLVKARQYVRKTGFSLGWGRSSLVVVATIGIYFLFVSNKFLIKTVILSSNESDKSAVEYVLQTMQNNPYLYLFPRNHLFFLTEDGFLKELQKEIPSIRSINLFKKVWPNIIELGYEERQPKYVWQTGDRYYLLDQDGVVFQEISDFKPEIFSQILITDMSGASIKNGEVLNIGDLLHFIEELKRSWSVYVPFFNYVKINLTSAKGEDVLIETGIGFKIYFDVNRDVLEQLKNLHLLLTQQINPETYTGLSYIDLRSSQTAYYCYKDAPCALENQINITP